MKYRLFNSRFEQLIIFVFQLLKKFVDIHEGLGAIVFRKLYFLYKTYSDGSKIRAISSIVKKESIVLDIGANIGFFSIYLSKFTEAKIFAFEPELKNYRMLCDSVSANKLKTRVIPMQYALSDITGSATLYLSDLTPMDHKLINSRSSKSVSVPSITCDDFFEKHMSELDKDVSLIKIDVQGAEMLVFSGMQKTLQKKNYPPILIEYSPHELLQADGITPVSFFKAFSKLGYLPCDIKSQNIINLESLLNFESQAYSDILMIHHG